MFQGFPEIKEALISNQMQAAFMVAPMAIALRAQGVPVKIVYLGHRYGSAFVVAKDGPVHSVPDLRGKVVAIPSRFSAGFFSSLDCESAWLALRKRAAASAAPRSRLRRGRDMRSFCGVSGRGILTESGC